MCPRFVSLFQGRVYMYNLVSREGDECCNGFSFIPKKVELNDTMSSLEQEWENNDYESCWHTAVNVNGTFTYEKQCIYGKFIYMLHVPWLGCPRFGGSKIESRFFVVI